MNTPVDGIVVERVKLGQLNTDLVTARTHDERNVDAIAASLKEHGQYLPILIQRSSLSIVKGKGVYLAMRKLGWDECDVHFMDVDNVTATRIALRDNRSGELAGWDNPALADLLMQLEDFESLGWNQDEFDALLASIEIPTDVGTNDTQDPGAQEDKATELQAKWNTALGQLWLIPSKSIPEYTHRLLVGDSTKTDDVRSVMDGKRAVLFSTDPPYLVNYDGTNHPGSSKNWSETYHDWDGDEKGEQFYHDFISAAIREAITDHAAWYCWHASVRQAMLERVWQEHGAFVHQQIFWKKDRGVLTHSWYLWQHEYCFFGWIRGNKPRRVSNESHGTVWEAPVPNAPGQETLHPTSKPTLLFEIPMQQHVQPGEICYEPFAGSGSQFVAGEKLGRLVYGIEIQPQYVAVILERLAGMGLKPRLVEGDQAASS